MGGMLINVCCHTARQSLLWLLYFSFVTSGFADLSKIGADIVFVIEASEKNEGAGKFVRQVLSKIRGSVEGINRNNDNCFRLGVVLYRNENAAFLSAVQCKLTSNVSTIGSSLQSTRFEGGKRHQAAMTAGIELALSDAIGWNEYTSKHIILVASSPNSAAGPPIPKVVARVGDFERQSLAERNGQNVCIHTVAVHVGTPDPQLVSDCVALSRISDVTGFSTQLNAASTQSLNRVVDDTSENIINLIDDLRKVRSTEDVLTGDQGM